MDIISEDTTIMEKLMTKTIEDNFHIKRSPISSTPLRYFNILKKERYKRISKKKETREKIKVFNLFQPFKFLILFIKETNRYLNIRSILRR